jgi:type I restriction enzyme M protein
MNRPSKGLKSANLKPKSNTMSYKIPVKDIKKIINNNTKFLDDINQILHNGGVLFEKRIDIILQLLHSKFNNTPFIYDNVDIQTSLTDIINNITVSKEELFQKVFMFYGSKYLKKEFDQFYTPLTIGEFICNMCIPSKMAIDPACGTGDLLSHYKGSIHLWDISSDVIGLAKQNYKFLNKSATILSHDSILNHNESNGRYDYAIVNPPFGSKTVITNSEVLDKYILGRGKKKQELGILFIERSINLLKDNGILYIILPNGYFGNTTAAFIELRKYILQYRILGIIKLPQKSFSRSGTGVSTSILILSKTRPVDTHGYDIFIDEVVDIGYELNKKNTPYKYRKDKTEYIVDAKGEPILQNDLYDVRTRFECFVRDNSIPYIFVRPNTIDATNPVGGSSTKPVGGSSTKPVGGSSTKPVGGSSTKPYQVLNTTALDDKYILDISRYLNKYKDIIENADDKEEIRHYLKDDYNCNFKKLNDIEYTYLDIKEINTPLYNGKKLYGHELPNRAKYMLQKNDILVSRLKGNIAFTVILEDKDNLVCTNGVCVLRPKNEDAMLTIFANLFSSEFKVQHQSLTTGSIMETLSEEDIKNIIIDSNINEGKYRKILDSIKIIQSELANI